MDCSICNYSCSQKGTLIKHIATLHEGKKTFKCSICDYCSSEKEQLKIHISSVHKGKKTIQMLKQLFKKVALNSAHALHQIMMIKNHSLVPSVSITLQQSRKLLCILQQFMRAQHSSVPLVISNFH